MYHRLPPALRSVVASGRGYYLRWWRYSPETERQTAAALEREHWSQEHWRAWQDERLGETLHRAATRVQFYREQWSARRRAGDRASWEHLENWPVLEKQALRDNPKAFLADGADPRRLLCEQTSGTTGTPMRIWSSRSTVRQWYALSEARWRRWYGLSLRDRWAIVGGQLVVPRAQQRPPFWVWNAGLNQLYLSAYHLAPHLVPHYLDALRRYRVRYLLGYTSALHSLAQAIRDGGHEPPRLEALVANAEPVFTHQRETIEAAFRCSLRETYGMSEMVAAASQCEAGALHWWPEVGRLEIMEGGQPLRDGEVGDLVTTGLLNPEMPLIRYRTGDRASVIDAGESPCACGRRMPRLASIDGRADDVLYTPDGRAVGRLDPVFKADLGIREAQIVQESLARVRVRYVSDDESCDPPTEIASRLRERLGEVEVVLEQVHAIPRTANGKFRAVLCQIPSSELPQAVHA